MSMQFSLYYFANEAPSATARDRYRLILDSAAWADQHGFVRLWTPERHFHSFGGLSPNPSVLCAALAARTHRVQLCAGSQSADGRAVGALSLTVVVVVPRGELSVGQRAA